MNKNDVRDWRLPPEPVDDSLITERKSADVVVVGCGYSGTAALRTAVEAGASVIALEAMPEKGFSAFGREYGHINSKFLDSRGVPKVDEIEMFNDWQLRNSNRPHPKLVRSFIRNSGECFDWVVNVLTAEEIENIRVKHWPAPRHFKGSMSGLKYWVGTAFFTDEYDMGLTKLVLRNHSRAAKLGVDIRYGMRAQYLIKEGGRVTGVVARTAQGQYHRFDAKKAVILAGGDFSGNEAMVADLCDEIMDLTPRGETFRSIGRDGSGIRMGLWAGGVMSPSPIATMGGNYFYPSGIIGNAPVVWLDRDCERYCNEGFGDMVLAAIEGLRQPKGELTAVFDSAFIDQLQYQSIGHAAQYVNDDGENEASRKASEKNQAIERMRLAMQAGSEGIPVRAWGGARPPYSADTRMFGAETLQELADYLGLDEEKKCNFLASIERYNAFCRAGRDDDFGKDPDMLFELCNPPYFAFKREPFSGSEFLVTVDGLWIDDKQRVLNEDKEPIAGLLATGNNSGRRWGVQYSTPIAGVSIGIAWTLGREAGKFAAGLE